MIENLTYVVGSSGKRSGKFFLQVFGSIYVISNNNFKPFINFWCLETGSIVKLNGVVDVVDRDRIRMYSTY